MAKTASTLAAVVIFGTAALVALVIFLAKMPLHYLGRVGNVAR